MCSHYKLLNEFSVTDKSSSFKPSINYGFNNSNDCFDITYFLPI